MKKITNCIKKNNININSLYYDEAHHTNGDKIKEIVYNDIEFNKLVDKTEFYTATPVNRNGILMYDRDNPENSDCGQIAYEYLYYKAIEDKISRKYEVCLNLCLKSPETKSKYEYVFETIIRHCLSGKYDYWNILTFHSGVNLNEFNNSTVVKEFANDKKLFVKIQNKDFPKTKFNVEHIIFKGVHAKTRKMKEIISNFDKKIQEEYLF